MKNIIILLTTILLTTTSINSEENNNKVLPDNCYAEYKVSPTTLGCNIKRGFRNLYTKKDGSLNVLGKFFNAKSLADLTK